jgi:putative Mn2+ efflux pump MntP
MDLLTTFLIAVGLAMDAFAVCLSVGTRPTTQRSDILRLSWHFGVFQGLMTFLGWLGGSVVASLIANVDHWLIFALLGWVGGRMIYSGISGKEETFGGDPARGGLMVALSLATSLDALAVGFSLAMLPGSILLSCLIIAVVTFAISLGGGLAGNRLGARFGKGMEIVGGLVLIGIGLRVLITYLFG